MPPVLVDSSVWIDHFNGHVTPRTGLLPALVGEGSVVVADFVLLEVLQGFRSDREYEQVRDALLAFPIVELGGATPAVRAAQNFRELRARGITVRKPIDCLIATFCIDNGHLLLHNDRDFDPFEQHLGLQVLR